MTDEAIMQYYILLAKEQLELKLSKKFKTNFQLMTSTKNQQSVLFVLKFKFLEI